jgi:hypothetical protein
MSKQTNKAVDWLISELMKSKDYQRVINDVNHSGTEVRDVIAEAKIMEKLNIYMAYLNGHSENFNSKDEALLLMDKYYTETFDQ